MNISKFLSIALAVIFILTAIAPVTTAHAAPEPPAAPTINIVATWNSHSREMTFTLTSDIAVTPNTNFDFAVVWYLSGCQENTLRNMWSKVDTEGKQWTWKQYISPEITELWVENTAATWSIQNLHNDHEQASTEWKLNYRQNGVELVSDRPCPRIFAAANSANSITLEGDHFIPENSSPSQMAVFIYRDVFKRNLVGAWPRSYTTLWTDNKISFPFPSNLKPGDVVFYDVVTTTDLSSNLFIDQIEGLVFPHITTTNPLGGATPGEKIIISGTDFLEENSFTSVELWDRNLKVFAIIPCGESDTFGYTECSNTGISFTAPSNLINYGDWFNIIVNRGGLRSEPFGFGMAVGPHVNVEHHEINVEFDLLNPEWRNLSNIVTNNGDEPVVWTGELIAHNLPECAAFSHPAASVIPVGAYQDLSIGIDSHCLRPGSYQLVWELTVGDGTITTQTEQVTVYIVVKGYDFFIPMLQTAP